MFTGIIERTGIIRETRAVSGGRRLRVSVGDMAHECPPGSSVCVSGVCLTVAAGSGDELAFDVIKETLNRSTLASKRVGDRVNLERSLRASDRLDGHFVQGHVDGTAILERVQNSPFEYLLWLRPDKSLRPCIIPKGSVAVDGVSLTIAAVAGEAFSIALIPTTLERTTLSSPAAGDVVNIETDIIARTVVHWLSELSAREGLTLETLREAGFA
jgi:riboflavin synthase